MTVVFGEKLLEKLNAVGELVRTQDNAITADPIFTVQEKKRIYGLDGGYGDGYIWIKDDVDLGVLSKSEREEIVKQFRADHPEDAEMEEEDILGWLDYRKLRYQDIWLHVQPFFTREGAEDHIRINGHNLNEPRIWVASAFRNDEWQAVRELLTKGIDAARTQHEKAIRAALAHAIDCLDPDVDEAFIEEAKGLIGFTSKTTTDTWLQQFERETK
jgi:hypothetical protein